MNAIRSAVSSGPIGDIGDFVFDISSLCMMHMMVKIRPDTIK
jgi:hypothetical protein